MALTAKRIGIVVLIGACAALAISYWHLQRWADAPMAIAASVHTVEPGTAFSIFRNQLVSADIVADELRFDLLARLEGATTRIKTGEYEFEANITPRLLLEKVTTGDVMLHPVRIVEGGTTRALLTQLAADSRLAQTLPEVGLDTLPDELGIDAPFAEGIFFPDTYLVRRGDSDRAVLERAHGAMQSALDELLATAATELSRSEVLILASIIEKETGRAEDRAEISRVFHNRLDINMALQTDPTVIYALGDEFDGNLTRAHLRMDSPFNTYRVKGLPPTPIAIPSRASIEAALHPADNDFLYFVARGDGTTQFSETLEEHNAAVREFQLRR